MIKTIVVAVPRNRAIGKDNDLLWHLPDDFKFFKETTRGHHILMGRKTYESLGKPLPKRVSIVITRNETFTLPEGHHVVRSLEEGIALAERAGLDELMIIGGGFVYAEALEKGLVDKMYVTEIDAAPEGADTFFPDFDKSEWNEKERVHHPSDERHAHAFDFVTYEFNKDHRNVRNWKKEMMESDELSSFLDYLSKIKRSGEGVAQWNANRFIASHKDGLIILYDDPYYVEIAPLAIPIDTLWNHFS